MAVSVKSRGYPSDRAAERDGPAARWQTPWFVRRNWGILLCAAYPLLVLTPLLLLALAVPSPNEALIAQIAVNCAVAAFAILALQFLLMARFRWIEGPFGLDVVVRFHQAMALVAVCLLCAHPLLLASVRGWAFLTRWNVRGPIWAGRIALLLLFAHGAIALARRVVRLRYEAWLAIHNAGAFVLMGLAFVHGLAVGGDLAHGGPRVIWISLPLIAWSTWFYGKVVRPHRLAQRPYKIVAVARETSLVWTLTLEPPAGTRLEFAPGQFQFLRPLSGAVHAEEHPFSIASSPASDRRISLTIKQSGDFTSTIGNLRPGDRVALHGPFGRFSHVFHGEGDDLVFVAAGVGITPLMSMLRHMRDCRQSRRVLLVYANRESQSIVFRQELEAIQLGGFPALKVVHVLSCAPDGRRPPLARLDAELLEAICRDFSGKRFFICCPPTLTASLIRGLTRARVPSNKIHTDYFGL